MSQSRQRIRVLIVDDEVEMCWALQAIVAAEGYCSTVAHTGREALKCIQTGSHHLAFVDLKLPDMEGLDLAARLHQLFPTLPCVLVSGYLYDDDDLILAGLKAGIIAGFIGKPFLLDQVREALRFAKR